MEQTPVSQITQTLREKRSNLERREMPYVTKLTYGLYFLGSRLYD